MGTVIVGHRSMGANLPPVWPLCGACRQGGPRRNQPLLPCIDTGAETLQSAGAEQCEVARLAEDHLINRLESGGAPDGVADGPRPPLAVGHPEPEVLLHDTNSRPFERGLRNPCEFRPGIDEQFRYAHHLARLADV